MTLNDGFKACLRDALGEDNAARALEGLEQPASVSVRLNPSKSSGVKLPILEGSVPVAWSPYGHILKERPVFTLHPLFHSGVYYVQDSSAMYVGEAFRSVLKGMDRQFPLRVLDLCAAPGGKTTDIAASLREACGDDFILVANEVMRNRATVLADNVARWGDPCVVVTSADPSAFGRIEGFFDIIVADVPCSGEGMFRKDDEAVEQWSEENVKLCAQRQRRIIADVFPALAEGGAMIYSTCTFNRDENDGNVEWICRELGAVTVGLPVHEGIINTAYGRSLVPGFVPGEGQYCAAMMREGGPQRKAVNASRQKSDPLQAKVGSMFRTPVSVRSKGELLKALPCTIAAEADFLASNLPVLSSGCAVGQFKGKDLVPDEDLALCISVDRSGFACADVDKGTALAFLHKDPVTLAPEVPKGIVMLLYKGVALGFVKNLGNRTNNLHPQGRRIRMDI